MIAGTLTACAAAGKQSGTVETQQLAEGVQAEQGMEAEQGALPGVVSYTHLDRRASIFETQGSLISCDCSAYA